MLRRTSSRASSRYGGPGSRRGLEVLTAAPTTKYSGTDTLHASRRTINPPSPAEATRLARRIAEVSALALMSQSATHTPIARYTTFNAMWTRSDATGLSDPSNCGRAQRSHSSHGVMRTTSPLKAPRRTTTTTAAAEASKAGSDIPSSPYNCMIQQVLPPPSNTSGFRVASDIDDEPSNEHLRALVELLVDPDATGVEDVRLADFVAMTAKRQLRALNNDKACLEVILGSEQYQACKDARTLRLAGITTVGEWRERPDRVSLSAYSRGVLEQAYQRLIQRPPGSGGAGGGGAESEVMAWLTRTIQKAVAAELVGGGARGSAATQGMPLLQSTTAAPAAASTPAPTESAVQEEEEEEEDGKARVDSAAETIGTAESDPQTVPEKVYAHTTHVEAADEAEEDLDDDGDDEAAAAALWMGDVDVTGMRPTPAKKKKEKKKATTTPSSSSAQRHQARDEELEQHATDTGVEDTTPEDEVPMDAEDKELDAEIERLLRETEEDMAPPKYIRGSEKTTASTPSRRATKAAVEVPEVEEEDAEQMVEEVEEVEEVVEEVVEEEEMPEEDSEDAAPHAPVAPHTAATKTAASPAAAATRSSSTSALSPAKVARLSRLAELMLTQVNSADGYLHLPSADLKVDIKDGTVEVVDEDVSQVSPLALFSAYHAAPIDTVQDVARFPAEVIALKRIWDAYNVHQTALEEAEAAGDARAAEFHTVKSVEVLVQGSLWLRCISREEAVSPDAQEALPHYGFPLLSSDTRPFDTKRPRSSPYTDVAAQDVLEAAEAYKAFFRQKKEMRFTPFRPTIDTNSGCNVVMLSGSTLHMYETSLKRDIQEDQVRLPFAESMLGVFHILRDCQVLPRGVNTVHYHILVTQLPAAGSENAEMMLSGTTIVSVDLTGPFTAAEKKRLLALAEPLGLAAEMEEFECVEDIVRQIRETTSVNVIHDLMQNRDELEAMLTPTLVQLLPEDAESDALAAGEDEEGTTSKEDEEAEDEQEDVQAAAAADDDAMEEEEVVEEVEEVEEVVEEEEEAAPPPPVTTRRRATRKAQPEPEEVEEEDVMEEEIEEVEEVVEEEEQEELPPVAAPAARRRTSAAATATAHTAPPRAAAKRAPPTIPAPPATSRWNLQADDAEDEEEAAPRVTMRSSRPQPTRANALSRPATDKKVVRHASPTASQVLEPEDEAVEDDEPPQPQWFSRKTKPKRNHRN